MVAIYDCIADFHHDFTSIGHNVGSSYFRFFIENTIGRVLLNYKYYKHIVFCRGENMGMEPSMTIRCDKCDKTITFAWNGLNFVTADFVAREKYGWVSESPNKCYCPVCKR